MHDYEAEIRAASIQLATVVERRDVAGAELILGTEYALRASTLGEMTRAQWLAALPEYVVHSYGFDDVRIDVYGEVGLMRSRYRQQATVFGKDRSGELLVTDVWVKRDGRWQIVARHSSMV